MIDTIQLKQQVNIVDIISQFVPLKKQGKDYFGCCPFHGEKTPSFSVNEEKQFYHCFGCGENGDVLDFLMKYHGWDFAQAAKYLGADIESQPLIKIQQNQRRKLISHRLPPDHQQDEELAQRCIDSTMLADNGTYTSADGEQIYLPIKTVSGELVNMYHLNRHLFLAGAGSYNGAHWIIKNKQPSAIAVTSYELGNKIASTYGLNVAVCFTGAILKYMCKWNSEDWKLKPALTNQDDDYLAYEMDWLQWDGEKLIKKVRL